MVILELIYTTFKVKNAFIWINDSLGTVIQTHVKMIYGEITERNRKECKKHGRGVNPNYLIVM